MRAVADRAMQGFARLLIHVFFRRVEVEGVMPPADPVLVVANHNNGLVDGVLLMASLARYPRFLGKSTLFRIPVLWPFLKVAGVVPVYRAKEGGTAEKNAAAFRHSRELLAGHGVVAIFPEGISHDEPMLQPLRTGAARIALGAAAEDGTTGVLVVPVGLVYDAKARFRSRALVRIGAPIDLAEHADRYRDGGQQAVRDLTRTIDVELRKVSPSYESWQQALDLSRLAAIGGAATLADVERDARSLGALGAGDLREELTAYERDLALMGIDDAQLAAGASPARLRAEVASSLAAAVAALPLAAAGVAVHAVPYQLMKVVSSRVKEEGIKATVKLLGCTLLFTAVYVVLGILAADWEGPAAGAAVAAACPLLGYLALRLIERARRAGGLLAGARVVRERGEVVASVMQRRGEIADDVRAALQAIRR